MKFPRWIEDRRLRRKAGLHRLDPGRFRVQVARTAEEYEQAFRLVHVGYVWQGIEHLDAPELRVGDQHVLPESTVLVAYEGDRIVGTVTTVVDSPAGLPLDKDYPDELRQLRAAGQSLAEVGSFVIVERCQGTGVAQLLCLAAFRVAFARHTRVVIGIHPGACPLYRAVWGFERLGRPKGHAELAAPVAGMTTTAGAMQRHLDRHFPRPLPTGHPPSAHVRGEGTLPGLFLPNHMTEQQWARWKMPREVFQTLFTRKTDRLRTLDGSTVSHLHRRRSDQTLGRIGSEG